LKFDSIFTVGLEDLKYASVCTCRTTTSITHERVKRLSLIPWTVTELFLSSDEVIMRLSKCLVLYR